MRTVLPSCPSASIIAQTGQGGVSTCAEHILRWFTSSSREHFPRRTSVTGYRHTVVCTSRHPCQAPHGITPRPWAHQRLFLLESVGSGEAQLSHTAGSMRVPSGRTGVQLAPGLLHAECTDLLLQSPLSWHMAKYQQDEENNKSQQLQWQYNNHNDIIIGYWRLQGSGRSPFLLRETFPGELGTKRYL